MRWKSFGAWRAPLSRVGLVGTPAGRLAVWAGIFQRSQWAKLPEGASVSSTMMARVWVRAGAPVQASSGDWLAPSQVLARGISAESLKAEEFRVNAAAGGWDCAARADGRL